MIGFFKNRRALKRGREFARTITNRVEAHITIRVQPARERFIEVFKGRLETVFDDPEHDPLLVTDVEWIVFEKNLGKFLSQMRAELSVSLYRYDEVIQAANLQGDFDDYIEKRISAIRAEMLAEADALLPPVLIQIEAREAPR